MALYSVDAEMVAASAMRVHMVGERIRDEVAVMLADLLTLQDTWAGAASASFGDCLHQWQAAQAQVDAALDAISAQMQTAASVYAEAEARSAALFTH